MINAVPGPWLRYETDAAVYALPEEAHPSVSAGESVQEGDILAHIPPPPHLLALTEELHLSPDASRSAIAALDGVPVEVGAAIHSHRSGLRVRTARAPVAGTVRSLPEYGAIIVRPRAGDEMLRAMHAGVVSSVQSRAMIVLSRVVRCSFAFAVGPLPASGRLIVSTGIPERAAAEPSGDPAVRMLAHIGAVTELASVLRRTAGSVVVGTVSDAVAWELLTRDATAAGREDRVIIVLFGPGDPALGTEAVRQLRTFDGAMMRGNRRSGEIVIYPDTTTDAAASPIEEERTDTTMYVDPARWNVPCVVDEAAHVALLDAGARTIAIRTTAEGHGEKHTPVTTIAARPKSG